MRAARKQWRPAKHGMFSCCRVTLPSHCGARSAHGRREAIDEFKLSAMGPKPRMAVFEFWPAFRSGAQAAQGHL
eukprot:5602967-Pyramimonas_sp.AAC.1